MSIRVSLDKIIEGMEFQSDEFSSYLNTKTGEIVTVSDDEMRAAQNGDDLGMCDAETVAKAEEVLESDDWLGLPTSFDIHEYNIMEQFCLSRDDPEIREKLYRSIKGRGAFRYFKDRIHEYGIADEWYRYRDAAIKDIAIEWCQDNGIELEQQ